MIQTYVIPTLQRRVFLQETILVHGGALPHNASSVHQLLRQALTDVRVNSRFFSTAWPRRSPNLTPCDFWLWSFLKDNIYRERLITVFDFKNSIRLHKRHLETIFSTIFLFQKLRAHHLKYLMLKHFSLRSNRTASKAF
ncbi:uncharacterized protein TNCV_1888041 [Trichonephila clavipes]|nr:uncharacterized protein TNCV_1888041 [Trichonephila clavipes]